MMSLLLVSMPVGFIRSLTGLGGASILVPLLVFLGIPVKEAIASAMVTIIATSSGTASSYVRARITNVKLAMYLEMFTITGAIMGATVIAIIAPVYLYFFFAAFLLSSFLTLRGSSKDDSIAFDNQDNVSKWLELRGSYFDEAIKETVEYKVRIALLGGMGMLVAGLAAGMLGIGAGTFKVTVQENLLKMPPKASSATSNFVIGRTALAGTSIYLFSGLLNITLMAPMAVGTTIGAVVGGRVLNKFATRSLRMLFFAVVAFLIAQMLYKGVASL